MKQKGFRTIRSRLMRLGRITIIFVVIVLVLMSMVIVNNNMKKSIYNQSDALAESYSSSVSNVMERVYFEINELAHDREIGENYKKMNPEQLKDYLVNNRASHQMFYTICILDPQGMTYDGFDLSKRGYYQIAQAGTPNISSPVFSAGDKIMTYYVAQKMDNGVADGVVFAGLELSYFYDIIKGFEESNDYGGLAFVVDRNGTYVVSSDEEKLNNSVNPIELAKEDKSYESSAALVEKMITGESGRSTVTLENGVDYFVSYKPVGDFKDGWSIAVLIPETQLAIPLRNSFITNILIGIIAVIVSNISFMRYSKKISTPVVDVAERLKGLENGDLRTSVHISEDSQETYDLTTSLSNTTSMLSGFVDEISETLRQISIGNLDVRITSDYSGDFGPLKDSLNTIIDALNKMIFDISRSSSQVSGGSGQVAHASQALSQGVNTQASAIEELSATIDEISKKVNSNAENARTANENSANEAQLIKNGSKQMQNMMEAMKEINTNSSQIANIIKTIDDIAFQTNILALNAAVEAARAGSAGKGFAVVADEVRNLAAKSAEAAQTTTSLIENAIAAVENGTKIADETAVTLQKIVENSTETTKLIAMIARASDEQAYSISEVTQGIDQISSVVQSNSSTSEESAASAQELSAEAHTLNQLVGQFRLRKDI
ncbi:MAG: methyl-accepting chemotaxis protein [Oscillospiraceae bacterium]